VTRQMVERPEQTMEDLIRADGRYPLDAFAFLHEALAKAVQDAHGPGIVAGAKKHVSGQQLCEALRELALDRWGQLARAVLTKWNIHSTMDFGNMVFLLVEGGLMRATEQDSVEDFRDVYDFDEAFGIEGKFELKE